MAEDMAAVAVGGVTVAEKVVMGLTATTAVGMAMGLLVADMAAVVTAAV